MPETEIQRAKTAPASQGGAPAQPEAQATAQAPARPGAMSLGDYRARLRRPGYAYLQPFAGPIVAQLESGAATGTEHARLMARLAALFAVSHSADGFGETDAKRASNAYHAELGERAIGELERIATAPGERTPGERWDAMTTLARKLEHDHRDLLEDDVALTVDLGTRDAAERAGGVEGRLRIAPNYLELLVALMLMAAEQQLLPQVAARAPHGRTALDRRGRAGGGANVAAVTDAANRDFAGAARAALGANVQIDAAQVADGAAHRLTAGGRAFTVRLMVCPLGDHVVRPMINPSKTDVIQISDRAAPSDVGRAIAHALGEIAAFRRAFAGNALPPVNDALRAGAPAPAPDQPLAFSAHDQGAIAQLGQMLPRMSLHSSPEQLQLRKDVLLLIDALGLRGGGAAAARREAVEARLRELGVAKLFFLRVMAQDEARLSGALQRSLFEARLEEATEQRVEQREQIRHEPLHQPALQGARRTLAEAQRLAQLARGRRTAKSLATVAKYRRAELEARPDYHRVRDPQIGGGAALANVRPGQLLIDDRGRWQQDAGDQLAQTAAQLRWVRDAGIGDPFEFVDRPDERVPLAAVHYWLDTVAMQAGGIDGTAGLAGAPHDGSTPYRSRRSTTGSTRSRCRPMSSTARRRWTSIPRAGC